MIVLVCGGRDLNPNKVCQWLEDNALMLLTATFALPAAPTITLVIEGGATGADQGGEFWAIAKGYPHREFAADWLNYGHAAGAYRNRAMLTIGRPNAVISFPGGPGTDNMRLQTRAAHVPLITINGTKDQFK